MGLFDKSRFVHSNGSKTSGTFLAGLGLEMAKNTMTSPDLYSNKEVSVPV